MHKKRTLQNILVFLLSGMAFSTLKSQINSTSFASKVDFSVGTNTSTGLGTIADLNNDNKPEVLVTYNSNSTTGQIAIFSNNASQGVINTSSFSSVVTMPALNNVLQLDAADLDGDGKADIVASPFTTTNIASSFSIYRNTSAGSTISFTAPTHISVPSCTSPVKLKDIDGDGKADLIAGFWYLGQIRIYRNISTLGNISFDISGCTIINVGLQPSSLACNDFSGDGITDIAICNYAGNSIMVFKNMSSIGTVTILTPATTLSTGSLPARIIAADMDNDTKMDLVVSNYNSSNIGIFKNTCSLNNLGFSAATTFSSLANPLQAACADLDADGRQDIVVGYEPSSSISIWRNFGLNSTINANTLGNRKEFTSGGTVTESYVADIDSDGKPDIIMVNRSNGTVSVFKNQTKPSNGLVAYYPFTGNAGDSSGFENNGTPGVGVSLTNSMDNTPNTAYNFNGASTSKISASSNPSLDVSLMSGVTFSCWIKPVSSALTRRIINLQTGTTTSTAVNIDIAFKDNNKLEIANFNLGTSAFLFYSNAYISTSTWSHIVLTIDSLKNVKLYINDSLDYSFTASVFAKPILPTLTIGNHLTNSWNYIGLMDEVRIYNRAITMAEVDALYNSRKAKMYYSKASGSINLLSTWGTNIDGTGTSPLSFDSSNVTYNVINGNTTLSGSLKINGLNTKLVFGDGSNAYNFIVGANDTISADSIYVNNNITITANGTLQTLKLGAGASSTVQYVKTSVQSLAGGQYENIVISGSVKNLTANTVVSGTLLMLNSIVCNGYDLTLGTSVSNKGTLNRTSGSIVGRFVRWYSNSTNSGTSGLFPIGTSTKYTPMQIEFTTAPTSGGKIGCEFIASNPGNVGLPQYDFTNGAVLIDKAAIDGFWRVTNSGITGGNFTGTTTANNFTSVNSYADLRMIRRSNAGSWVLQGNANIGTGSNTSAIVSRTGLTTLAGEYGIGGDISQNPLPVKLTQFNAVLLANKDVHIKWQTAYELNANKFVIQRSTDRKNWIVINQVKARGNSNSIINYELIDNVTNLSGQIYYRLVEIDLNGEEYMSDIVGLNIDNYVPTVLNIYPNPTADKIEVKGLTSTLGIYDLRGVLLMQIEHDGIFDISSLEKGIYIISDKETAIKLIRN
ncbi:MAG: FG-GAP-like repeat-containing protein [Bacteroidota bacterium]